MANLNQLTLHAAADLLARRACSSAELVHDVLAAIERTDRQIGAYLTVDAESALAQARAADAARAAGDSRPLLGVPLGIKDLLNVAGQPCTCGSRILVGYRSPYDATCVARINDDRAGYAHLAPLALERGSGNVYARDLQGRDSLLLVEYSSRPVYLMRRKGTDPDAGFEWLALRRDSLYASWRKPAP